VVELAESAVKAERFSENITVITVKMQIIFFNILSPIINFLSILRVIKILH
jgi:hypothetical protein